MKKNCICCVLLFVMLFSTVVYAGLDSRQNTSGGRTVTYHLQTAFNRVPFMSDNAKATTTNDTANPALMDSRCYCVLFAYDGGKACDSATKETPEVYSIVLLNVNCDEFGGQGMLLHSDEWKSQVSTPWLSLNN